jgi:hypothetical protein
MTSGWARPSKGAGQRVQEQYIKIWFPRRTLRHSHESKAYIAVRISQEALTNAAFGRCMYASFGASPPDLSIKDDAAGL